MTEQCMNAMLKLYAREGRTCGNLEKAVIEEALDELVRKHDSTKSSSRLVRDAMSNARKKVGRAQKQKDEGVEIESIPRVSLELEEVEVADMIARAELTPRQRLVVLRRLQGYQVEEIAEECGVTDKTIYRNRQEAWAAIQGQLEPKRLKKAG